jgi:DNA-binding NtrC family response regulator
MKLKVLLLEDKGIIGLHLKKVIQAIGLDVPMVFKNCDDALHLAEHMNFDIVISDVNLEGDINGIECYKMLQQAIKPPVIFITGFSDKHRLEQELNIDHADYLIKPFREDELQSMINAAIAKYKLKK